MAKAKVIETVIEPVAEPVVESPVIAAIEPYFKTGERYYSASGTSGVYFTDSRNMKGIKIEEGVDFNGQKSFRYVYAPSELEWSKTPCCVVDSGKLRALAYEIDRTLLHGLGMPSGKSYDALNLQQRMECTFAVGLDEDSVAGLREIRLNLRSLVEQLGK